MAAYRYRLILMAAQPSVVGEPISPTQTVTGVWSKPSPIVLTGQRSLNIVTGNRPAALAVTGNVTFARQVS